MTAWKQNNLLRESETTYWKWHTDPYNGSFKDKDVISLTSPNRYGVFRVKLANGSFPIKNGGYAVFTSREDAEDFAAKAFPGVSGEAYKVVNRGAAKNTTKHYIEVETEYGPCLVPEIFVASYIHRIDASNIPVRPELYDEFHEQLMADCEEDLEPLDENQFAYSCFAGWGFYLVNKMYRKDQGLTNPVIEKRIKEYNEGREPVTAAEVYAAYYEPQRLEDIINNEDVEGLYNMVVEYVKDHKIDLESWSYRKYNLLDFSKL